MSLLRRLIAAAYGGGTPAPTSVDAAAFDGQSNALGTGDANELASLGLDAAALGVDLTAPLARVLIYNYDTAQLEPLHAGVNNMSSNKAAYCYGGVAAHPTWAAFGPELGYAYAWLQDHPTGQLVILKDSGDAQPISYFAAGTARDTLRLTRHAAARAALLAIGLVPDVKGAAFVQGEADLANTQAAYAAAGVQRIADWRSDGTFNTGTVLVLPQITPGSGNYAAAVNAAKVDIAATDPAHIKLIPYTDSRRGDNVHLTTYGALRQGANIYAAVYGVAPVVLPGD